MYPLDNNKRFTWLGCWLQNLEVYTGIKSFFSYTKTLTEMVEFLDPNVGIDDKVTDASMPVMFSSGRNLLYV